MFTKIRQAFQHPAAPVERPHGVAGLFHDLGQWVCDNIAVFLVGIPAIYLIARSIVYPH